MTGPRGRWRPGWSRGRWRTDDGESGQITLLTLGFAVVAIALILVVASASSIHLERKRLLALADGAAADAADAIDYGRYYEAEELALGVPLSDASVRTAVDDHLDTSLARSRFDGLSVRDPTGTPDGRTAEVTLSAVVRPPLVPWVLVPWAEGFNVRVTSMAEAEG